MGILGWAGAGVLAIGLLGTGAAATTPSAEGAPEQVHSPVGELAGDISRSFGEGVGQAAGGAVDESFGQLSWGTGAKVVGGGALLAGGAYGIGRGLQGIGQGVGQGVRDRIKNPRPPLLEEHSQTPVTQPPKPTVPDEPLVDEDELAEPTPPVTQPAAPRPTPPPVVIPAPPPVPAATPLLG